MGFINQTLSLAIGSRDYLLLDINRIIGKSSTSFLEWLFGILPFGIQNFLGLRRHQIRPVFESYQANCKATDIKK